MSISEDETIILSIIQRHYDRRVYNNMTFSISQDNLLDLEKTTKKCIDEILDIYLDETKIRQKFVRANNTEIYISEKSIINHNKKFLALAYISYLLEMITFYITHTEIYVMQNAVRSVIKPEINPNTLANPIQNTLLSNFSNNINIYSPRRYTNNIITDFRGNGFMGYINSFRNFIENEFNTFCDRLLTRILRQFGLLTRFQLETCFYANETVNFTQATRYNFIYDNWIDRILIVLNTPDANKEQVKQRIENIVFDELEDLSTRFYSYIEDAIGFFTLQYLLDENNRRSGCCITSTYIEHYILLRLFFDPSRVKLIVQCEDCLNNPDYHHVWTYTQKGIYDTLLSYKRIIGISHWFTNVSDNKFERLEDVRIIRELDPVTQMQILSRQQILNIQNRIRNNRISGRLLREIPDFINNPILKPQSSINDIENYFKLFVYPILDNYVYYITRNSNILINPATIGIVNSNTGRTIIIVSQFAASMYELFENKLNKFKSMNRNISINLIKDNLDNLYDLTYDIAGDPTRQNLRDNINLINTYNVTDIVNNINDVNQGNRFTFDIQQNSSLYFDRDLNGEIDESETFLKDIMTKFVNNHFYNDDEITYNFFKLINTVITNGITEFMRQLNLPEGCIKFIFKGGNMLRLLIDRELQANFNEKQIILFIDLKKDIFKKSDSDFQIYVKDLRNQVINGRRINDAEMDDIYDKINKLAYLLLNRIRNIILLNPHNYINFMKLNDDEKTNLFQQLLISINNSPDKQQSDTYRDVTFTEIRFENISVGDTDLGNFPYVIADQKDFSTIFTYHNKNSRGDMLVYERGANQDEPPITAGFNRIAISTQKYIHDNVKYDNLIDKNIEKHLIYKNKNNTNFYISYNNTINIHRGSVDIHFNLLRIKINFSLTYHKLHPNGNTYTHIINIPGEYIDISIPHYTTSDVHHIFEQMDNPIIVNKPIISYNINILNKQIFQINSYSYNNFIDDLETVLFYQNSPPWLDNKYEKRIKRLLMLYSVDLLKKINNADAIRYYRERFDSLKDNIHAIINNLNPTNPQIVNNRQIVNVVRIFNDIRTIINRIFSDYPSAQYNNLYIEFLKIKLISRPPDRNLWISKYTNQPILNINDQIIRYMNTNPTLINDEFYNNIYKFYKEINANMSTLIFIMDNFYIKTLPLEVTFTSLKGGKKNKKK